MLEGLATVFHHLSRFNLSHKIVDAVDEGMRSMDDLRSYQPGCWSSTDLAALKLMAASIDKTPGPARAEIRREQPSGVPSIARRPDLPTLRGNVDRESAKRKLETCRAARDEGIASLSRNQYANSSRRPRDMCWATWCAKAEMMGVQPLPLRIENVSAIMSAFNAEGYKSVRN